MLSSCVGNAVLLRNTEAENQCVQWHVRQRHAQRLLTNLNCCHFAVLNDISHLAQRHNDQMSFRVAVFTGQKLLLATKRERFINYCSEISIVCLQYLLTVVYF